MFGADLDSVLQLNKLISDYNLELETEVIVPITCGCVSGQYYQGNVTYVATGEESVNIACVVFQGLISSTAVVTQDVENRDILQVPIECACPGMNRSLTSGTKVNFLLTYRFKSGDDCRKLAEKFAVPVTDILEVNGLDYRSTVFTNTTALVPLTRTPIMSVSDSPPPNEMIFLDEEDNNSGEGARVWSLYVIIGGASMFIVSLVFIGAFIICAKAKKTQKNERQHCIIVSPISPCLSPEVLTEIKYYSLIQYSIDELRSATRGFDEGSMIDHDDYGGRFYMGKTDNGGEILIIRMSFEEIRDVIDAHSRINHKNILNLIGVCYAHGAKETETSYLVFEFPSNGCLRQLLERQAIGPAFIISWSQRMQIAFDIAMGIHYLHYCIFPSSVRTRISTRNVFVTEDWRAKIVNMDNNVGREKDDIVLFGTMLFEIISGRVVDAVRTEEFGESVAFLSGGGCFEKLKGFVDARLRDDYPLAEALCLAVLAKACVEDDPVNRPSIDDIIKVLARII